MPSGYTVTRNGSAVPSGSGCFGTIAATSCTDSGLSAGTTYTYTVTAVVGTTWRSNASSSFQATTGPGLVEQAVAGSAAPGSGNTIETPTLPSAPTNGDTLILLVADEGNHSAIVSTVTGGGVGTWNTVVSTGGTADQGEAEIWYGAVTCAPCGNGNEAVTVTMNQNTNVQMANVSEWAGVLTSGSPVDQKASGTGSASSFAAGPIPASGNLSQAGELIVSGAYTAATGYTSPQDATTGYTALSQTTGGGAYYRGFGAYQIDASAAQISATWTTASSNYYATAIAAFKP